MSASRIIGFTTVSPGHEGIGGGLPLARAGALLPRRGGERVGASLTLAGPVRFGGGPVLSRGIERLDRLPQGGAGLVVGKASHRLTPIAARLSAAFAAVCHGAAGRSAAP